MISADTRDLEHLVRIEGLLRQEQGALQTARNDAQEQLETLLARHVRTRTTADTELDQINKILGTSYVQLQYEKDRSSNIMDREHIMDLLEYGIVPERLHLMWIGKDKARIRFKRTSVIVKTVNEYVPHRVLAQHLTDPDQIAQAIRENQPIITGTNGGALLLLDKDQRALVKQAQTQIQAERKKQWERFCENEAKNEILEKDLTTKISMADKQILAKNADIQYMGDVRSAVQNSHIPIIGIQDRWNDFYSMWMCAHAVCKTYERPNGSMSLIQLHSTAKNKPLRLQEAKTVSRIDQARRLVSLAQGDFCTTDGIKLYGTAAAYAAMIFDKVQRGIEIFPADTTQGYRIPIEEIIQQKDPSMRHWGQDFLSSLRPMEVKEGQLLGSGCAYRAYFFPGNKVIVECDEEGRATYLINQQQFEVLRNMPRSHIMQLRPPGFDGRIIHAGDNSTHREAWRAQVAQYIAKQ